MEFIREWGAVAALAAGAGAGGVAALDYETRDQAVEESVGVVAVEEVLEEGAGGEGCLGGEEGEGEGAGCGVEEGFCGGLGFEIVEGGHFKD